MISARTLLALAQKGKNVHTVTYPAGPRSPAWVNHFATKGQAEKDIAGALHVAPVYAAIPANSPALLAQANEHGYLM